MVYYFKAKVSEETEYSDFGLDDEKEYTIYMGKDKHENDPLIKKSHPKNLWFHVDKHSSAHLYLQLSLEEQSIKFEDLKLEESLLTQLGQLTKANSIKANKLNNITIIYTPVDNLYTDGTMDTGTVSFKNGQKVKRIHINKKENSIINKLNKTKSEVSIEEFISNQQTLITNWQSNKKMIERNLEQQRKEEAKLNDLQKQKKSDPYADLFNETSVNANSNEFRNENWVEEDFW